MSLQPVEHPSVWRGKELQARPDWNLHWTDRQRDEIEELLKSPAADPKMVAPHVLARMAQVQDSLENGCGGVLIQGLNLKDQNPDQLITLFETIAGMVGQPISQSAQGERIFSVRDAGLADSDPRARGPNTKKKLSFHTDRCDVIGFLCIQQARSGGENQVVSSPALFNEILARRPDLLQVLTEPYYYLRHNVDTANQLPWTRQPIFSFRDGYFAANLLRVLIERAYAHPDLPDMSPVQREALDYLEELAADPEMHVTFRQQPGDILFLNNWVTLHRRTAFEDHDEPHLRRHILRVWLSMPNSRPLDPMFAGNYGNVEAGAIRGGMQASQ